MAGDLNDPASRAPALDGADGVFLLPGYADMPGILAGLAKPGFSMWCNCRECRPTAPTWGNAITRYMADSERAARDSGIAWTIIRPAALMTNAYRWLPQLRAGDKVRLPFANVRAATIDTADIAEVAATALTTRGHEGRVYSVSGPSR